MRAVCKPSRTLAFRCHFNSIRARLRRASRGLAIAALALAAAWPAAADQVITLSYTRDTGGVTLDQCYILVSDNDPDFTLTGAKATLLLFVGGSGRIGAGDGQIGVSSANYLLRTRRHFAAAGPFNVAVMDAASDFLALPTGLRHQRLTAEYLEDMERVVADLRVRFPGLPVYAMGTSRGSIGAAFLAASLSPAEGGPDGLVLTSSVTRPSGGGDYISLETPFTIDLAAIGVPSLVVAHEEDGCVVTPPEDAEPLRDLLAQSAPEAKLKTVSGGLPPLSTVCQALSEHGFFGVEQKSVDKISKWIDKQVD
jgi:hypothetical protein